MGRQACPVRAPSARAAVLLAACCMPFAPASVHAQTLVDYQPGIRLGQGFEVLDDSVRGECVAYEKDEASTAQGQREDYRLFEIADSYQMTEVLNLSLSMKYKSMFGSSAEGKASLARNRAVTQFANTFMVRSSVRNPVQSIVKVRLTEPMAALARSSPADFRQRCGNHFVSGVITGGEFFGYVAVQTQNVDEQEKLSASYSATYGLGGSFQSQGQADKDFLEKISNRRTTIEYHRSGGKPEPVRDVASMYKVLEGFADSVRGEGAVPYQASLQPYTTLPNFPVSADTTPKEQGLARILERAWQLRSLKDDVAYVRAHPGEFAMKSVPANAVVEVAAAVNAQLETLEAAANRCRTSGECTLPASASPEDLRDRLPLRYRSACAPVDVEIPPLRIDAYRLTRGDGEMDGHSPRIDLQVTLTPKQLDLVLAGTLKMTEAKSDWTTFEGQAAERVVHTLRSPEHEHCRYDADQRELLLSGGVKTQAGEDVHGDRDYQGNGIVTTATCTADTRGNDTGKLGCKSIAFQKLRLKLRHEEEFATNVERRRESDRRKQRFGAITKRLSAAGLRAPAGASDGTRAPGAAGATGRPGVTDRAGAVDPTRRFEERRDAAPPPTGRP